MGKRTHDRHPGDEQLTLDLRSKRCPDCQRVLPAWNFHRDKNRKDGLTVYCAACHKVRNDRSLRGSEQARQKKREAHRRWRLANLEEERKRTRDWAIDNPDKNRAAQKAWHRANRDAQREAHRAWVKANPNAYRVYGALRRVRKLAATTVPFSPQQLAQRWAYYGNKCWVCRGVATATDHVKPLSKGGAHMLCNLRPICKPCNSSKRAQWPYAKAA